MKQYIVTTNYNGDIIFATAHSTLRKAEKTMKIRAENQKRYFVSCGFDITNMDEEIKSDTIKQTWDKYTEYKWEITSCETPVITDPETLMGEAATINARLRNVLLKKIKAFILKNGVEDGHGNTVITIDNEIDDYIDPVYLLVETDRHSCNLGYERMQTVFVDKKNELGATTEYYDPCQAEILDDDLKGVYRLFEALKTNEDVILENGVIKLKEDQPPTNE